MLYIGAVRLRKSAARALPGRQGGEAPLAA